MLKILIVLALVLFSVTVFIPLIFAIGITKRFDWKVIKQLYSLLFLEHKD